MSYGEERDALERAKRLAKVERLRPCASPEVERASEVTPDMVERLRRSLWSTWGADRQTTDWPSDEQLRTALEAAIAPVAPAVAMGQCIAHATRNAR